MNLVRNILFCGFRYKELYATYGFRNALAESIWGFLGEWNNFCKRIFKYSYLASTSYHYQIVSRLPICLWFFCLTQAKIISQQSATLLVVVMSPDARYCQVPTVGCWLLPLPMVTFQHQFAMDTAGWLDWVLVSTPSLCWLLVSGALQC